jgi:hypothetical protein
VGFPVTQRDTTTHAKISHLVASLPTNRQQIVFALLVPSCQQVWSKLLITCNNLVDINRLVARLFQQVRCSHDITILLIRPCLINLVKFFLILTVSDLSEQPCNKSDKAIKLVTSCEQLIPNLLQQLGTSSANTTC